MRYNPLMNETLSTTEKLNSNGEYKNMRFAESKEYIIPNSLDVVAVIPVMNEGYEVLFALRSIAHQQKGRRNGFSQGVVLVINNRPDASNEIVQSNMDTYILLQSVCSGFPVSVRGRRDLDTAIRDIQQANLPILIIDSFSEGNTDEKNNVGRARKIGTDFAVDFLLKPEGFVISTDADTTLHSWAMYDAKEMFATTDVAASPMLLNNSIELLSEKEQQVFRSYELYWQARQVFCVHDFRTHAIKTLQLTDDYEDPYISDRPVYMGGAYSVFRGDAYKKVGGYRPIGSAEDTTLGQDMADAGLRVENMSHHFPNLQAYTLPRISFRTDLGYGHGIGRWQHGFAETKVINGERIRQHMAFLHEVSELAAFRKEDDQGAISRFIKLCESVGITGEFLLKMQDAFENWNFDDATTSPHMQLIEGARAFFEQYGTEDVPMKDFINDAEDLERLYSVDFEDSCARLLFGAEAQREWSWDVFSQKIWDYLDSQTLDPELQIKCRTIILAAFDWLHGRILHLQNDVLMKKEFRTSREYSFRAIITDPNRGVDLQKYNIDSFSALMLSQESALQRIEKLAKITENDELRVATESAQIEVKKRLKTYLQQFTLKIDIGH